LFESPFFDRGSSKSTIELWKPPGFNQATKRLMRAKIDLKGGRFHLGPALAAHQRKRNGGIPRLAEVLHLFSKQEALAAPTPKLRV